MTFDTDLLDLVACPACHASFVRPSVSTRIQALTCSGCGLIFPVIDGIPVLLIDEAIGTHAEGEVDA